MTTPIHDRGGVIWRDGELVQWRDAQLHFLTHSLHYGMAVLEGVRAYETERGTAIFRPDDHTKRLFNSTKIFEMDIPFSFENDPGSTVRGGAVQPVDFLLSAAAGSARQRAEGTRRARQHSSCRHCRVAVGRLSRRREPDMWYPGENVAAVAAPCQRFAGACKGKRLLHQFDPGNREVTRNGYDEALLLDTEGYVPKVPAKMSFSCATV